MQISRLCKSQDYVSQDYLRALEGDVEDARTQSYLTKPDFLKFSQDPCANRRGLPFLEGSAGRPLEICCSLFFSSFATPLGLLARSPSRRARRPQSVQSQNDHKCEKPFLHIRFAICGGKGWGGEGGATPCLCRDLCRDLCRHLCRDLCRDFDLRLF